MFMPTRLEFEANILLDEGSHLTEGLASSLQLQPLHYLRGLKLVNPMTTGEQSRLFAIRATDTTTQVFRKQQGRYLYPF